MYLESLNAVQGALRICFLSQCPLIVNFVVFVLYCLDVNGSQ